MSNTKIGTPKEWFWPALFLAAMAWTMWHMPAFILDFMMDPENRLYTQITNQHAAEDVTPNMAGLFGGVADPVDWLALILIPISFVMGMRTLNIASMEFPDWRVWDRPAIFLGRVTMIMVLAMTSVMLWEVMMRYLVSNPTIWGNELTLWLAGFIFLTSGIYGMQQRSHIRIFLLYDIVPRWMQRLFDTITTVLIVIFAFGICYGSYSQVFVNKFYRWELFGTAFNPPIPATIQPYILIVAVLIAAQAVANLIADWNRDPEVHSAADDIDEDELEAIKRSVGAD